MSQRHDSPPSVDGIWHIWGSSHNIPMAIFDLLKSDYMVWDRGLRAYEVRVTGLVFTLKLTRDYLLLHRERAILTAG